LEFYNRSAIILGGVSTSLLLLDDNINILMSVNQEQCFKLAPLLLLDCFSIIKECYPSIDTDYFEMMNLEM
jgi:hypothetical protein